MQTSSPWRRCCPGWRSSLSSVSSVSLCVHQVGCCAFGLLCETAVGSTRHLLGFCHRPPARHLWWSLSLRQRVNLPDVSIVGWSGAEEDSPTGKCVCPRILTRRGRQLKATVTRRPDASYWKGGDSFWLTVSEVSAHAQLTPSLLGLEQAGTEQRRLSGQPGGRERGGRERGRRERER